MEQAIRSAAKKVLPPRIRSPLGSVLGRFREKVIMPLQGAIFDLTGSIFRVEGCRFSIPRDVTTRAYRSCFLNDSYEREERELIRRWLKPTDRVIELGACLGIVSCVTNSLLKDKSGHVVVEGNPFCIGTLYRNKEMNNAGFLIEHCAVGSGAEVTFYLHPKYIVGGSSQRATNRPFRLPAKSLRKLEEERGPFTALIIDVEGSELDVFGASLDLLKKYRLVVVELHEFAIGNEGVEKCREMLREAGLELVGKAGLTEAWQRPG
jgi:FkbM family methyltransferase